MDTRERRNPGPDHQITIELTGVRFVARAEDRVDMTTPEPSTEAG